jgi:two-component system LytT family response regulator
MIKALLVDDEAKARNILHYFLTNLVPEVGEVQHAESVEAALQVLQHFTPDIVFLDIEMPNQNGFDFLLQLKDPSFDIIFTTAYNQYAIQAIRFSALDYLLKPIDADELRGAVDKFMARTIVNMGKQALYQNLLHNLSAHDKKDFKLALPTSEGTYFFMPEEIIRLEGESNYTKFFFTNRKSLLISKTLKEYEELLGDYGFIRIHKSHLVNKKHVVNYTADGMLTMVDHSRVEISRRRKEEVMDTLKSK